MVLTGKHMKPILVLMRVFGLYPYSIETLPQTGVLKPASQIDYNNGDFKPQANTFWNVWSLIIAGLYIAFGAAVINSQLVPLVPGSNPNFSYFTQATFFTIQVLSIVYMLIITACLMIVSRKLSKAVTKLYNLSRHIGDCPPKIYRDRMVITVILIIIPVTLIELVIMYKVYQLYHISFITCEAVETISHTMTALIIIVIFKALAITEGYIISSIEESVNAFAFNDIKSCHGIKTSFQRDSGALILQHPPVGIVTNQSGYTSIPTTEVLIRLSSVHQDIQNYLEIPIFLVMLYNSIGVTGYTYYSIMDVGNNGTLQRAMFGMKAFSALIILTALPKVPCTTASKLSSLKSSIVIRRLRESDDRRKEKLGDILEGVELFTPFSVCGLFTLTCSNIVAILSFIATYLVILMQFDMSFDTPDDPVNVITTAPV